jgi:hypothetical protein
MNAFQNSAQAALSVQFRPFSFSLITSTIRPFWVLGLFLHFISCPEVFAEEKNPVRTPCALLELELHPDTAHVKLNGEYLDSGVWLLAIPPGAHEFQVGSPGFQGETQKLTLVPGERRTLIVRLKPTSAPKKGNHL